MTSKTLEQYKNQEVVITLREITPTVFNIGEFSLTQAAEFVCYVLEIDDEWLHYSLNGEELHGSIPLSLVGMIQKNIEVSVLFGELNDESVN